jgi:tRNA G18 (ribose-2'-O)-methylase SpoU
MGASFSVPVAKAASMLELPGEKLALVPGAGPPLAELSRFTRGMRESDATVHARPVTLLVGSERQGLPDHLTAEAHHTAHIPSESQSLNAAMAATIALCELTRELTHGVTEFSIRDTRGNRGVNRSRAPEQWPL